MQCHAGISKYLRHSDAVSGKYYDFGVIEQSSRNREALLQLIGGDNVKDIETESNSTVEQEKLDSMTASQLTVKVFEQVKVHRPVTVMGKVPAVTDVRGIIAADLPSIVDDDFLQRGPKNVTQR